MRTKIMILGLICLLMLGCALSFEKKSQTNSWRNLFTEPVEIVYFIMKDNQPFRVSNEGVKSIHVPIEELKKRLKNEKEAYEIKDIAIVIHNHRTGRKFSPADWKFYGDLKEAGIQWSVPTLLPHDE